MRGWKPTTQALKLVPTICGDSAWSDTSYSDSDTSTVVNDCEEGGHEHLSPLAKDEDTMLGREDMKPKLTTHTVAIEIKARPRSPSPEPQTPPSSPEEDFIPLPNDDEFPEVCQLQNHHGHSTRRLKFLRDIWEIRQFEWQEWERDNENQTAYDGILSSPPPKPFHPTPPRTAETPTPLSPISPVVASSSSSSAPIYPRAGNLKEIHDLRSVMLDRALGDVPLHSISKALFLWNMSHARETTPADSGDLSARTSTTMTSLGESSLYASSSSLSSSGSDVKSNQWNQVLFQGLDSTSLARYQTLFAVLDRHDYARKISDDFLSELSLNGIDWHTECARAEANAALEEERAAVAQISRPKSPRFFLDEDEDKQEGDEHNEGMAPFDDGGRARYEYGDLHMIVHPGDASMSADVDRQGSDWGEYEDMCF